MRIYLAGAMSGIDFANQLGWRREFSNKIVSLANKCDGNVAHVFNPCLYYNLEETFENTEREPFEFDLYNLKNSDIVVANLK